MPTSSISHTKAPCAARRPIWRRLALSLLVVAAAACDVDVGNPNAERVIATPTSVISAVRFTRISSGFFHTCALAANGGAWCWGSNEWSQIGTSAILPGCSLGSCSFVPVTSGEGREYRQLSAGTSHTCAIATTNQTFCWGGTSSPTAPLLGDGGTLRSPMPVRVQTDSVFVQVSAGGQHACGVTASGEAWCWGRNEQGQLGDGTRTNALRPVKVTSNARFSAISAGADFTCALTTDAAVFCWGSNAFGQLGTGDVTFDAARSVPVPARVVGTTSWRAVASGGSHACALANDGRVFCWGRNDNVSQLGDSSFVTQRGVAAPVKTTLTFASLAAGAGTTCALTAGGDLWCWGGNAFANAGNGRANNAGEPVPVKALGGPYLTVAPGASHTCAIEVTGDTRCWGDRFLGATGSR